MGLDATLRGEDQGVEDESTIVSVLAFVLRKLEGARDGEDGISRRQGLVSSVEQGVLVCGVHGDVINGRSHVVSHCFNEDVRRAGLA